MKEQEAKANYWLTRLEADSKKLKDDQKLNLLKAVLVNYCELTDQELAVFLQEELPTPLEPESLLTYAMAEKKVGDFFGGAIPNNDEKRAKQNESFVKDFKTALIGVYTSEEADDIFSVALENEYTFVALKLYGIDFHHNRRVRNAYLPKITTLVTGDVLLETGEIINMQDSTNTLFDGPGDAVSQIDRLLSRTNE